MLKNFKNYTPSLAKDVYIAEGAKVIGNVTIGRQTNIWYNTIIRGDVNNIIIGEKTNIQDLSLIHVATYGQGCYIGDSVTIGHCAILHACTVKNKAYIGMQACLLDGAIMEDYSMLAAGALLTTGKVIPTGELWAGSPAKFMRKLTQKEYDLIDWSADHYVTLAQDHYAS